MHNMIRGKNTSLILKKRRLVCPQCNKVATEENPFTGASINLVPVKQRKYLKKELKNIRKNTSLKHENRGVNMSENKVIDKQFKLDAVQYRKDHPELTFQQVADNLGVSNSSIHRWCKQFDDAKNENEDSNLFRGSGNFSSDEAKELARLKKENRDLKDAVEILKKAMSIISSQ